MHIFQFRVKRRDEPDCPNYLAGNQKFAMNYVLWLYDFRYFELIDAENDLSLEIT